MLETDNLKLPLYELDDAANLADGYNDAMRKVDAAYQTNENRFPITSADIEDGGVNAVDIANGAITSNKIATAAVTDDKLAVGAVTAPAIEDGAVGTDALDAGAVTAEKLADGSVTLPKLASSIFDAEPTKDSDNLVDSGAVWEAINAPKKPLMVVIGDSWSDNDYQIPGVTKKWPELAAAQMGVEVKNYAVGGTGFLKPSSNDFTSQLTNAINDTSYNHNDVKYVVVYGGINDTNAGYTTDPSLWVNVIAAMYTRAVQAFPYALVKFFIINRSNSTNAYYRLEDYIISGLREKQIPAPTKCGWWVKMTNYADINHPNQAGETDIASKMVTALTGGTIPAYTQVVTFTNSVMNNCNLNIAWNESYVMVDGSFTTINTPPSSSAYYPMGSYIRECPYPLNYLFMQATAQDWFHHSNVGFAHVNDSTPGIYNSVDPSNLQPANKQLNFKGMLVTA